MRIRGFTLIEMLVTLVLLAILAAAVAPVAQIGMQHSKERELRQALRQIRDALDAYKQAVTEGHILLPASASGYPASLQVLVDGVTDQKNPNGGKLYFLRRIPRDPMNTDETIAADLTWGKRSYASPWDHPREGVDVYDVYSLSTGTGLNGVPYRSW